MKLPRFLQRVTGIRKRRQKMVLESKKQDTSRGNKLLRAYWGPAKKACLSAPQKGGIYAIGLRGFRHPIYIGQSNNIRDRLQTHFRKSSNVQAIDKFVNIIPKRLFKVKYVQDRHHKDYEGVYLAHNLKHTGSWPVFNLKHGNSRKKKSFWKFWEW
ncbi:uncharacterized protein LOC106176112 [Lingula anatina]|uniref:Uncharacterized protein LOC106176112 n=1 Tax=Lingula anatina TaxID=7574 RepID=A0A1S3JTZ4_LINAN|nr:uncharacterized protein LOC106176112 [Lingula anatina]|eukprot:XP_013413798.2 uncharacterized protein LOC106176112 [Lingula anatina]